MKQLTILIVAALLLAGCSSEPEFSSRAEGKLAKLQYMDTLKEDPQLEKKFLAELKHINRYSSVKDDDRAADIIYVAYKSVNEKEPDTTLLKVAQDLARAVPKEEGDVVSFEEISAAYVTLKGR